MTAKKVAKKQCPEGHEFYKSSDCPTCPDCEAARKPGNGFLSELSAPARRALETENISTAKDLSRYSENEILALHGMGPASMPKLKKALANSGLAFKTK